MKKIQTGLRLTKEQHDRIKKIADRSGNSINSVILQALDIGFTHIERAYETQEEKG